MNEATIKSMVKAYRDTGRIACYYPRLKRISLNGGGNIPVEKAIERIVDCLKTDKEEEEAKKTTTK